MSLEEQGRLHPNGNAAQAYLRSDLVADSACPLQPGDEFTAAVVPHSAVVLLPDTGRIDYPITLTVRDPTAHGGTHE